MKENIGIFEPKDAKEVLMKENIGICEPKDAPTLPSRCALRSTGRP